MQNICICLYFQNLEKHRKEVPVLLLITQKSDFFFSSRMSTTLLYTDLGRLQLLPSAFSLKLKKSSSFNSLSKSMRCSPSYHLGDPPEVYLHFACISFFWGLSLDWVHQKWPPGYQVNSRELPLPWACWLWSISVPSPQLAPSPQERTADSPSTKISKMIHWDPLSLIRGITSGKQKSFKGNAFILARPFLTAASNAVVHQNGYWLPVCVPVTI